jgi:catechol 2,3-dioxygenase-like lactoylglutathione lyase family enzyme
MIPSIHHVQIAIPTKGEDQARTFYGHLLGLQELPKPKQLEGRGGLWFRSGNMDLHLGVDPSFIPTKKAHVAFEVVSLTQMRSRIEAYGFEVESDVPLPGLTRFHTADPFGNRVEIVMRSDSTTPHEG